MRHFHILLLKKWYFHCPSEKFIDLRYEVILFSWGLWKYHFFTQKDVQMLFLSEMRRFPPFNFSINPLKIHYIIKKNKSKIPARINAYFTKKKKSNGNWVFLVYKDNLNSIIEIKIKLNIYLVLQINGQCSYFFRHKTNHNWKNWISSNYKEVKCYSWYFKWTNSLKTVELHEGIEKYDIC